MSKSKPCKHCGVMIAPCNELIGYKDQRCGVWECAYYSHVAKECTSTDPSVVKYQKRYKARKARL